MNNVVWLRVLLAVLLLTILIVAAVPLLVLLNLAGGGSGFGLCTAGIIDCRTPFTAGPELALGLVVVLFVLVAVVRVVLRVVRTMERRDQLQAAGRPVSGRPKPPPPR